MAHRHLAIILSMIMLVTLVTPVRAEETISSSDILFPPTYTDDVESVSSVITDSTSEGQTSGSLTSDISIDEGSGTSEGSSISDDTDSGNGDEEANVNDNSTETVPGENETGTHTDSETSADTEIGTGESEGSGDTESIGDTESVDTPAEDEAVGTEPEIPAETPAEPESPTEGTTGGSEETKGEDTTDPETPAEGATGETSSDTNGEINETPVEVPTTPIEVPQEPVYETIIINTSDMVLDGDNVSFDYYYEAPLSLEFNISTEAHKFTSTTYLIKNLGQTQVALSTEGVTRISGPEVVPVDTFPEWQNIGAISTQTKIALGLDVGGTVEWFTGEDQRYTELYTLDPGKSVSVRLKAKHGMTWISPSELIYSINIGYTVIPFEYQQLVEDEPVVSEPIVNEPVDNEPIVSEPVVDEPVVDEPTTDIPVVDETTINEPVVEDTSTVDETPAVEETNTETSETPVVEEIIDEDTPAESLSESLTSYSLHNGCDTYMVSTKPEVETQMIVIKPDEIDDSQPAKETSILVEKSDKEIKITILGV